ncbi:hypothetical protein ACOME3_005931 [Neoechinorhynchus agilis]
MANNYRYLKSLVEERDKLLNQLRESNYDSLCNITKLLGLDFKARLPGPVVELDQKYFDTIEMFERSRLSIEEKKEACKKDIEAKSKEFYRRDELANLSVELEKLKKEYEDIGDVQITRVSI